MTTMTRRAAAPAIDSDHGDDWREQSACRTEDPELFYPLGGNNGQARTGANLEQEERAKAVCGRCPVSSQCLADAMTAAEDWGIWGGLNEAERRELRGPKQVSPGLLKAQARSAQLRAERIATRTHCDRGHELTPENTYHDRSQRVCRTCRQEYQRTYRETHRAVSRA